MANLQQRLKLKYPIIQAPMAGVQGSALAIAVGNAGGLGSLPCAMLGAEAMQKELEAIRSQMQAPINVNFFSHRNPEPDVAREQAWRRALAPYYAELELDPAAVTADAARRPFSAEAVDVLEAFKPEVVSFHFGLPSAELLQRVRSWGAVVLSSATTVEEARWLEANGADAIIAQGAEAGGHRAMFLTDDINTQVGIFALLPQIIEAVKIPVIASGGIADARGVAAMLSLGAQAVQVGTAYLLCPEATTSAVHCAALKSDAARHTAMTNVFSGRPARGIVNRAMRELGPMSSLAPAFPLASSALAPLRAKSESLGSGDFTSMWAGQNVSGCREIPAGQLTRELAGAG